MSLNVSRKGSIGVAAEPSFATPTTATDYIAWTVDTLEGVNKPIENVASYAMRNKVNSAVTGQKWGQGDVEMNLDPSLSGYLYAAALGSTGKSTVSGAVQLHTHTVNQSSTPYSLSLNNNRIVGQLLYTGATVDTLETKVSNGLATVKAAFKTLFPVATTSGTLSQTTGTIFTWANYTYQFGTTYANATGAAAAPLTDFDFTIKNNTEVVFESGQNGATRIGQKDFEIDGKFTLYFENLTDRNNFYNTTNNSMIVKFLGAGAGAAQEKIQYNFYNTFLNTFSVNTGLDAFYAEQVAFVGNYSSTDNKTFDMTQVNSNSNY